MKKNLYFLLVLLLFGCFCFYYVFSNKTLDSMKPKEENLVGSHISPERNYKLDIYFNGGIVFMTDVTYLGVLENLETKEKKNILLVSTSIGNVGWEDNSTIFFQNKKLDINKIYDFRKDN